MSFHSHLRRIISEEFTTEKKKLMDRYREAYFEFIDSKGVMGGKLRFDKLYPEAILQHLKAKFPQDNIDPAKPYDAPALDVVDDLEREVQEGGKEGQRQTKLIQAKELERSQRSYE